MTKAHKRISREELIKRIGDSASHDSGKVHVIYNLDGYAVKKEGAKRARRIGLTEQEAIAFARGMKDRNRMVIHKPDGSMINVALRAS